MKLYYMGQVSRFSHVGPNYLPQMCQQFVRMLSEDLQHPFICLSYLNCHISSLLKQHCGRWLNVAKALTAFVFGVSILQLDFVINTCYVSIISWYCSLKIDVIFKYSTVTRLVVASTIEGIRGQIFLML